MSMGLKKLTVSFLSSVIVRPAIAISTLPSPTDKTTASSPCY